MLKRFFVYIAQPLHPSWSFYAAVWGVIAGIIFGQVFYINHFISWLWLIVVFFGLFLVCHHSYRLILPLAFGIGIVLGIHRIQPELYARQVFTQLVGTTVELSGQIADDPNQSDGQIKFKLQQLSLSDTPLAGNIYVQLSSSPTVLERSDRIVLRGKLASGFGNYTASLYRPEVVTVTRAEVGDVFARLKQWFIMHVSDFISHPALDLGLGYLIGQKSGLSESFITALSLVGMTHVVVASGAHLGILVGTAQKIFGKLSKFAGLMFALLFIFFFVAIVGFTPSMTRAALVSGLSLSLGYFGRKFTPWRLLSFVAMLTLLLVPDNFQNLGWQLSFASFFGIMILGPNLQKLFYGGKKPPWLANMLITSIATSIVCAPILIYNFGSISFLSLAANLVILPTLPYAMLLVFLTGVTSWWGIVASGIGQLATLLLNFHLELIEFLSEQHSFIINLPTGRAQVFLIYLPLALIVILLYNRSYES